MLISIREDVVDSQSFNALQSLVADYVFNKALSKRYTREVSISYMFLT